MGIKTEYKTVKPYITKDGSIIRELIHPNVHGNQNLSLASRGDCPSKRKYIFAQTQPFRGDILYP